MEGDGGRWAGLFYEGAEGGVPVPGVSGLAEVVEAGDADEDDGGRFGVGEGGEAVEDAEEGVGAGAFFELGFFEEMDFGGGNFGESEDDEVPVVFGDPMGGAVGGGVVEDRDGEIVGGEATCLEVVDDFGEGFAAFDGLAVDGDEVGGGGCAVVAEEVGDAGLAEFNLGRVRRRREGFADGAEGGEGLVVGDFAEFVAEHAVVGVGGGVFEGASLLGEKGGGEEDGGAGGEGDAVADHGEVSGDEY